ncbi:hypothetical protein TBLA_0B00750 [Henningerozyma blattae CBS 6284]|uniref:COP9 signalosome complex subunit 5 n=1 Tax=Henningerozyma blattae (strain ATCC 34711 / CBS 6284 / DSM 70876 / NBRC 10599 / NRRL Y-10934 / UCD 77-7) TaxID=1071380 RepID=I2GXR6_HENB6|nr:hypothetical protein TBLA_0B00750 [Tetrapisispora blattae CBS 6284]CCH58918.1 hypothetical protein TBLA_0B00750 [Tetrapisispora blattae CBS 6284]
MSLSIKNIVDLKNELAKEIKTIENDSEIFTQLNNAHLRRPKYEKNLSNNELKNDLGTLTSLVSSQLFFNKVKISRLACSKILDHTLRGGNVEVMGMLIGTTDYTEFIIYDSYALPVEGTETRVNAQLESYEYMVSYVNEMLQGQGNSHRTVIGWYHSHPGYDCWLSSIDMQTQNLNQTYQDPFVAIVVDPHKSLKEKKLAIGAFRTTINTDDDNIESLNNTNETIDPNIGTAESPKLSSYELKVEIFESKYDGALNNSKMKFERPNIDKTKRTILMERVVDNLLQWNNYDRNNAENQDPTTRSIVGTRTNLEPYSGPHTSGTRSASIISLSSTANTSDVDMENGQTDVIGSPTSSVNTLDQVFFNFQICSD